MSDGFISWRMNSKTTGSYVRIALNEFRSDNMRNEIREYSQRAKIKGLERL